jgi:hypothetical protein
MKTDNKKRWVKLLQTLPAELRSSRLSKATDDSLDENQLNYKATVEKHISPELLDRLPRPSEVTPEIASDPAWCVCEMPEGDFPRIRVFQDFEVMVRHLANLDGQEVSAWVFFGSPFSFTTHDAAGYRYLMTSSSEAHRISKDAGPVTSVPASKLQNVSLREDGWLGDVELAEASSESYYLSEPPSNDEFDPDDDLDEHTLEI